MCVGRSRPLQIRDGPFESMLSQNGSSTVSWGLRKSCAVAAISQGLSIRLGLQLQLQLTQKQEQLFLKEVVDISKLDRGHAATVQPLIVSVGLSSMQRE